MGSRSLAPRLGNERCPLGDGCKKNKNKNKHQSTNNPRAPDSAKVLFMLTRLEFTDAELQDGVAACLPTGECYGRALDMSVRLDAFPSSQCFTVSK